MNELKSSIGVITLARTSLVLPPPPEKRSDDTYDKHGEEHQEPDQ